MLGMPASLTNAIDLFLLRSFRIFGIFIEELCLLKLISLFEILNLVIIFFVCLVSSQAIKETFLRIFNALFGKYHLNFQLAFQQYIKSVFWFFFSMG